MRSCLKAFWLVESSVLASLEKVITTPGNYNYLCYFHDVSISLAHWKTNMASSKQTRTFQTMTADELSALKENITSKKTKNWYLLPWMRLGSIFCISKSVPTLQTWTLQNLTNTLDVFSLKWGTKMVRCIRRQLWQHIGMQSRDTLQPFVMMSILSMAMTLKIQKHCLCGRCGWWGNRYVCRRRVLVEYWPSPRKNHNWN